MGPEPLPRRHAQKPLEGITHTIAKALNGAATILLAKIGAADNGRGHSR